MANASPRSRTRAFLTRALASVITAGALTLMGASAVQASAPRAQTVSDVAARASGMGSVSAIGSVDSSSVDSSSVDSSSVDSSSATSVDAFSFTSFDADYMLGRDAEGHATLTTTETLVAEFPQFDQNHGIRRIIPNTIDGHPTDVRIVSVTDGAGHARSYDTDDDDDGIALTIAAKNFVHGTQTYVITYMEKNVIHYPNDADDEEFYRDVNGTGWAQQFGTVTGTLHVPKTIASQLTGQTACYSGPYGSKTPCAGIETAAVGSGKTITARADQLLPRSNLTMVVGFRDGTFTPRDSSFFASPAGIPMIVIVLLALATLAAAIVTRRTVWRDASGRPTIIAEYQPPKDIDVLIAGRLVKASGRTSVVASILDLAVRGILTLLQTEGGRFKKDAFTLKLERDADLTSDERRVVHAVFGDIKQGLRQDMSTRSAELGKRVTALLGAVAARATSEGYERSTKGRRRTVLVILGLVTGLGSVVPCIIMMGSDYGAFWPLLLMFAGIIAGIAAVILASSAHPLTALGAETRDHLAGLKLYIELAEADRMRVLQSPTGALRSATAVTDEQVLRLNERLLPYAVLFKRDKEWMRVLGEAYEAAGESPTWYSGSTAFNAAILAGAISSFNASSATWAGSSSNSSSSGFSGGGFSGGGGGGGGGGGV